MKKYISIVLTVCLLLVFVTACGDRLTPEEIFERISSADNVRMEMVINYDNIQTSTTVIEKTGGCTHVSMITESFGAKSGDEYFTDTVDGVRYIYNKNADGAWKKDTLPEIFAVAEIEGFRDLFQNKLYYEDGDRYGMYKTETADLDGMFFEEIEIITVDENTYRLEGVASRKVNELYVFGALTVTFQIGGADFELPKV